ncbi:MAG: hypothetical protein WBN86_11230 [Porticoccaceae bacterium]
MIENKKNRLTHPGVSNLALGLWVGMSLLFASAPALGHGGVSMEEDVCMIKIGPYSAHFTGYLPQERASQEFCEDIPVVTKAIFVIDFISDELRVMDIDFRIVRDVKNIGRRATYEDLGGPEAVEKATVFYEKPKSYSSGTISIHYSFVEPGGYVGVIEAHHQATGLSYRSVFPFYVGGGHYAKYVAYYALLFLFCGVFIWGSGRRSIFKSKSKTS